MRVYEGGGGGVIEGLVKYASFQVIAFGRTLVVSFLRLPLVLGGVILWYKEDDIKISGNKIKRSKISGKVDSYKVCDYSFFFLPSFILF